MIETNSVYFINYRQEAPFFKMIFFYYSIVVLPVGLLSLILSNNFQV